MIMLENYLEFLNEYQHIPSDIREVSLSTLKKSIDVEEDIYKIATKPKIWILYFNDVPAGTIIVDENPKEKFFGLTMKDLGTDIEIVFFYILPQYRSKGFGRKLIRYIILKYNGKYIGLGTSKKSSPNALRLYKDLGFKIVSEVGDKRWWLKKPGNHNNENDTSLSEILKNNPSYLNRIINKIKILEKNNLNGIRNSSATQKERLNINNFVKRASVKFSHLKVQRINIGEIICVGMFNPENNKIESFAICCKGSRNGKIFTTLQYV